MTEFKDQAFIDVLAEMLAQPEYLFPYVWAQRLSRLDNYQMAAQGALEDMFFDTVGDFIRRKFPHIAFERRTGKEPWDYRFDGEGFSHKEGLKPMIVAVWQPGDGPGNRHPRYSTWTFEHSVVFVYAPKRHDVTVELLPGKIESSVKLNLGRVSHETAWPIGDDGSFVILASSTLEGLVIEKYWPLADWKNESVHDLIAQTAERLTAVDFFLLKSSKATKSLKIESALQGSHAYVSTPKPAPGVYIFSKHEVANLPLQSNNKAHLVGSDEVVKAMVSAQQNSRFVPLPLWPALFADTTPPNLYQLQKQKFDALFAARKKF